MGLLDRDDIGLGSVNPLRGFDWSGLGGGGAKRKQPQYTPLPQEEQPDLKSNLINRGASGLQWIGQTLDKAFGARALRGLAVGDHREALSAIPFSDSLGITDPSQSHSMAEVIQHHGIVGENDPEKWEARDFLVPAAEILADPGAYLSFGAGAATKLGKVAKNLGQFPRAHRAAIEGFHAAAPALRAQGLTDDAISFATKGGQRIASDGVVDASRAAGLGSDVARKPLAGLVGVGLPFSDPVWTFGHGAKSQAIAGAFDRGWDALKYAPGVRYARSLFDPAAMRSRDKVAQQAAEEVGRPASRRIVAETDLLDHASRFEAEPLMHGDAVPAGAEREIHRLISQGTEGTIYGTDATRWEQDLLRRHAEGLAPGVTDPAALASHVASNWDKIQDIAQRYNGVNKAWRDEAERYGLDAPDLADEWADYLHRSATAASRKPGAGGGVSQIFGRSAESDLARKELLRDVPGGTEQLSTWAIDPRLSGPGRTLPDDQVHQLLLRDMLAATGKAHSLTPEAVGKLSDKAKSLAENWLAGLDPIYASGKVPYFDPDVAAAMRSRGAMQARKIGGVAALCSGVARAAQPVSDLAAASVPHVPLTQFLEQAGLKTLRPYVPLDSADHAALQALGIQSADEARDLIGRAATDPQAASLVAQLPAHLFGSTPAGPAGKLLDQGYDGAAARLYEEMARHGAQFGDLKSAAVDPLAYLSQYGIPQSDADALTLWMNGWQKPHELQPAIKYVDDATNMFKNLAYPLWPASHVRNFVSAIYNNWLHGTPLAAYGDAAAIMRGKGLGAIPEYAGLHPAWSTLTDAQRAQELHRLAYAHGKVFQGVGGVNELAGDVGLQDVAAKIASGQRLTRALPGDQSHIFGPDGIVAAFAKPGGLDPRGQAGLFGRSADTFAPLVAGRRVGTNIEDYVRLSNYLGNLRRGMSPEAAGALTNKIHFDYSDLTKFEQQVMKRVFPFYTFMRNNLPYQLEMLGRHPGNLQTPIRALTNADEAADKQGFTPEYLSSGVAIPSGTTTGPDGKVYTRFLAGTGLPFEEAFGRLRFHNRNVGGQEVSLPSVLETAKRYAGDANGLLTVPLELATDTSFHSGRRLSELHDQGLWGAYGMLPPEYAGPATEILGHSPLARFGSAVNTLVDPRKDASTKALNLLTGLKYTDVDLPKLYEVEARKELESQLRDNPAMRSFTNYYVDPAKASTLAPEQIEQYRLYESMKLDAKRSAADRKRLGL